MIQGMVLPLCDLHHKAFDTGFFATQPETLDIRYKEEEPGADDLNIRYTSLNHLHRKPHADVLRWRWDWWQQRHN